MKKIILLAGLLLCGITNAQVINVYGTSDQIFDGDVITFNTLDAEDATLPLSVENISGSSINLKLRMDYMENADNLPGIANSQLQFCFGEECYFTVDVGDAVPSMVTGLTLTPGGINPAGDHFVSVYPGDNPALPVVYTMSFIQVDGAGNQIGEDLLTFTYKYQPELGVNDFAALQNMGINVKNTVVKNQLDIDASLTATMQVYDINGKLVKTADIANGSQSVDLSALNTAVYIAKFTTAENKTSQIRIVKN